MGRAAIILLVAATVLLLPSVVVGTLFSHSSPQNLTWAKQFADQFDAGILYPRWMPESFDGLGAPTFYFYPPLGFWLEALLGVVTFKALSVSYGLSLSALLMLWASGFGMHAWLKSEAISSHRALFGAVAYMAAPYHLIDHYYRGAYAEFAAYAFLPLVILSIRRVAQGHRSGGAMLAASYAALLMVHLPTSLLISLTAIPAYVAYRAWKLGAVKPAATFFLHCALAGMLGFGLAAIYLVPALALQDWISAALLWSGGYRIENWSLLKAANWSRLADLGDMMGLITWSAAAYGFAALGTLALLARRDDRASWRCETAFWALLTIATVLIYSEAFPWFWQIPFAAKVQFPWRLMIVVEFAVITALCMAPWHVRSKMASPFLMAALVALIPTVAGGVAGIGLRTRLSLDHRESPKDAKEYEPAGYPPSAEGSYADLNLGPVERLPAIACFPQGSTCRAHDEPFGELTVELESEVSTTVVLRRFYFPYWQLSPPLPIVATDPLRLVSFVSPPGHHIYRLRHVAVPAEKAGWAISGLSLLLLAAWAGLALRKPQIFGLAL